MDTIEEFQAKYPPKTSPLQEWQAKYPVLGGSLSDAESLVKGAGNFVGGALGELESLGRAGINAVGHAVQKAGMAGEKPKDLAPQKSYFKTIEEFKKAHPERYTTPTAQAEGMENLGAALMGLAGLGVGKLKDLPVGMSIKDVDAELLASHVDPSGYSVSIHRGAPDRVQGPNFFRKGTMYLHSPEGKSVKGGYWMDSPEDAWGLTEKEYRALPEKERAAMEAKQQATYGSFKEQFDWRERHNSVRAAADVARGAKVDDWELVATNPESSAFKSWFEGSHAVDDKGLPVKVYRGGGSDLTEIRAEGGRGKTKGTGAWFSDSPDVASTYARGEKPNVTPVYLSLKNPLKINAKGRNWGLLDVSDNPRLAREFKFPPTTDQLARWARKNGYDGMIVKNVVDVGPAGRYATDAALEPRTLYTAFEKPQAKSAISNRGTYDSKDPHIMHAAAPFAMGSASQYNTKQH